MDDRSTWPKPQRCFTCDAQGQLVATEIYSQSITGVRTHLYVCTKCLRGTWYRYFPHEPGKFLAVDVAPTSSHLVRAALIGWGWTPPRGKARPKWTPPA